MNFAVLLSGGVGSRIASDIPKQYIRVNGLMMVTYALKGLIESPHIDAVCVTADPAWHKEIVEDIQAAGEMVSSGGEPIRKPLFFAVQGKNRQLSIWSGMQQIMREKELQLDIAGRGNPPMSGRLDSENVGSQPGDEADTVFIHDAARPYLAQKLIDDCFDALPGHDGVLPVLPMKDTVYESSDGHSIARLLDRSRIYAGQAPELFLFDKYADANRALLPDRILAINGSTEPAILAGMDVVMIPGDEKNCKVTTDADLEKFRGFAQL